MYVCGFGVDGVVNSTVGSKYQIPMDFRRNEVLSLHRCFGSAERWSSEVSKEEFFPLPGCHSHLLSEAGGLIIHANL